MVAFVRREPGGSLVEELLSNPENECFAHAANLCEVYYDACRARGPEAAAGVIAHLYRSGIRSRADMDSEFWQEAGRLKARAKRISLADCFGLTLARRLDGEFVTGDRHELEPVAGEYKIRFIR